MRAERVKNIAAGAAAVAWGWIPEARAAIARYPHNKSFTFSMLSFSPMSHIVKLLLVALAMVLPLRSYGAGAMLLCEPAHHGGAAAASASHLHEDGAAPHAAEQAPDNVMHNVPGDEGGGVTLSVCSACGASCTAAIAPPTLGHQPRVSQPSTPIAFLDHPFSGVVPENAERPPLSFVR